MPDAPGMNPLCWASAPCAPGWGGDSWGPNWTSQGLICLSGWDKPCIRLCAQPGDAAQGPPNPRRMAGGWGRDTAWGRGSGPTGRGLGVAMAGRREGTGVGDGTGQEGSGDFSPVGFSTRERASKGLPTWRPDDLGTPPPPHPAIPVMEIAVHSTPSFQLISNVFPQRPHSQKSGFLLQTVSHPVPLKRGLN